ncbi:SlyX family protein [Aeoliella sp. SH292]|uniref:SlyX family protein n=1 Tax=Aeoliella sp. SH292 TaxID=3454464 RepID=UPI003F9AC223
MSSHDRQTRLEEILAHQQHTIDALHEVVTGQGREIMQLTLLVTKLEAKVKMLGEHVQQSGDDLPHERPPHY